jgi:DNA helicase-2/ATP-dependent DNA helicase PcrA
MKTESTIFEGLNDQQAEAVRAIQGPVLILAGAGSGKTKALTHRIAHLIASGVSSDNILAVTFTNKAAGEIKERVEKLLKSQDSKLPLSRRSIPWMGTFHSICLKILRQDIETIGYGKKFVIYDDDDQLSLIKTVMQDLELDTKKFNPKSMLNKISKLKSELVGCEAYSKGAHEYLEKILSSVYTTYQMALKQNNALDFDDLIMLCVRLLKNHPEVLAKYQDIFEYILVDEYQDTNHAQYAWVNLLANKHRNLFVIGDDYQSIYNFRQADIRNILDFEKDYPEAKVILLEQNYRSTQNILSAANNIILKNKNQKHKKLWTENSAGKLLDLKEVVNERREGDYIVETILNNMEQGLGLADFTVLYRTHAQSRSIEEAMIKHGIPYRIIGGVKFYQRREIKDILAYLRLALNPNDLLSFERIYNVPGRGIGYASLQKVRESMTEKTELISYLKSFKENNGLGKKQVASFVELGNILAELSEKSKELNSSELVKFILKKLRYEAYINDGTDDGEARWENVKEIFTATRKFDEHGPEGLERFLEEVALIQDTDKINKGTDVVNMMTIHSSKGLEFPVVFLIGMEDGVFPHSRALFDPKELEEERRLCYVGITRAKQQLHMTFCRQRMLFGSTQSNPPSRFLFEIPESLVAFSPLNNTRQKSYDEFDDFIEY